MQRLLPFVVALLALPSPAFATWSVIAVDRSTGGGRDQQRLRVGVADVLGSEDDHPAGDEPRVLPRLDHPGQVVQRRVDV